MELGFPQRHQCPLSLTLLCLLKCFFPNIPHNGGWGSFDIFATSVSLNSHFFKPTSCNSCGRTWIALILFFMQLHCSGSLSMDMEFIPLIFMLFGKAFVFHILPPCSILLLEPYILPFLCQSLASNAISLRQFLWKLPYKCCRS